jgi:predicted CXXCH cytochrome family protein
VWLKKEMAESRFLNGNKMNGNKKIITGCIISFLLLTQFSNAKVTGLCANCHTMHNSQAGDLVTRNLIDGQYGDRINPNRALLNTNCIGCHQGLNASGSLTPPNVLDINGPNYGTTGTEGNTLAGGSFYWVSHNAATGHNVSGVAPPDNRLGNLPPGQTVPLSGQLTCAGTTGCHGDRTVSGQIASMLTAHHNNDMTTWKDGSSLPASYRFLNGIQGLEDQQYEYLPGSGLAGAGHHNKYYGRDRINETDDAEGTISSVCAQCHGDFHNGSGNLAAASMGSGVWLRHPTDFDMAHTDVDSEYRLYGDSSGSGTNEYSVISPVATANMSDSLNSTVFTENDDAIVMCLSCHRAHGTPYDAILRWDYKAWPGDGFNGCAVCHTSKD